MAADHRSAFDMPVADRTFPKRTQWWSFVRAICKVCGGETVATVRSTAGVKCAKCIRKEIDRNNARPRGRSTRE